MRASAATEDDVDRRQVTVLFSDVSGFTALAERLDPEELRAFQNALFEAFAQVIARYDGFTEKFVGDAVLAVFGAPHAHEDDPERALDAALDMVERCAGISDGWAARLGGPVGLHIGVHTGTVVAGSLDAAAGGAYAVTGDAVNTTARLLAAASGTILVSDATHALTRHRFAFEEGREIAVRGKAEPVVVHRLLGRLDQPRSARGLAAHGLVAPLVGRADEFRQLLAAHDRAKGGRAQMVSLVGDAGNGKSRLIEEFVKTIGCDGAPPRTVVRKVSCSPLGEPTYGVFGALFREGYDVRAGDSLAVSREKLAAGLTKLGAEDVEQTISPVLSYLLGLGEAGACELEPAQLHRQIALAAQTLVDQRVQQGPLVIVVDDFQWADAASVDLLRSVVDKLADRPLMMLLAHRPEADPPAVERAAPSRVRVPSLSESDTETLVGALFGPVEGDDFKPLQQFIAARAGGNPLFVEEIVRSLMSKGAFARRDGRWSVTAACDTTDVPPSLQGLLISRVDKLAAGQKRLLQEAAVLGMEFDKALLLSFAKAAEDAEPALDQLVGSDLICPVQQGGDGMRYRFKHALVREAVYQNLLNSRRTELHGRAGRALEHAVGTRPERLSDLEALSHHWSLSRDRPKGAAYLVAAGDWARSVYANEDAIRHYERALRTLDECDSGHDEVKIVRERLGDVLALIGRRIEAFGHYEAVLQAYEDQQDRSAAARLYRKLGGLHWDAGDREHAGASFALGLERLGEDGNAIERSQLFQEVGRLAFRDGDNEGAIEWARRALDGAAGEEGESADGERDGAIAATRALAYNTLGIALARMGRLKEAVHEIERSIALAETHDLLQVACRGYTNLGVLYSALDPRRSIDTCLRGLETAKKVGDLGFQSRLYANLAVSYCALTDRCEDEGVDAAQTAIDLDRRLDLVDHLAVPLIVLGQIHQCRGEQSLAFACYEEALGLAERAGEPQLLFPCYDGLATLHLDAGSLESAELYLAKSQDVCKRAGLEPEALMVLPFLC
jgi:adenylate cyclase